MKYAHPLKYQSDLLVGGRPAWIYCKECHKTRTMYCKNGCEKIETDEPCLLCEGNNENR